VAVFLGFAFAYFLSALIRSVTATLAPVFSAEMSLSAADLGLLAGAYFLGFASMQLPLGRALDRFGPRRTLLVLLAVAVAGCALFAGAASFAGLIVARLLIGVGVAACLMAALTCYRHHFSAAAQLRANSWMLMTGSLGMLASTLPVQALLPHVGWRGLFQGLALLLVVAMAVVAWLVPRDGPRAAAPRGAPGADEGYAGIVRHPLFVAYAPLAFVVYGALLAVQTLWAGPWLTRVAGATAGEAAAGLFFINATMLFVFMAWGALMPALSRRGVSPHAVARWGLPAAILVLAAIAAGGPAAGAVGWAAWCALASFVTLSQPAVGAAFPAALAGRALSAFNLVIFAGVFALQWGIGGAIDLLRAAGLTEVDAFRGTFAGLAAASALAYAWFVARMRRVPGAVDNHRH
jgi:MFS family permease